MFLLPSLLDLKQFYYLSSTFLFYVLLALVGKELGKLRVLFTKTYSLISRKYLAALVAPGNCLIEHSSLI